MIWSLPLTFEEAIFLPSLSEVPQPTQRPLESNQTWTGAMIFLNILVIVTLLFGKKDVIVIRRPLKERFGFR